MSIYSRRQSVLASIAGLLMSLFRKPSAKITGKDLAKADFKTSTQRIGLTFTDKIRDIFRFRWIRKT
jgi:hypothetical protein